MVILNFHLGSIEVQNRPRRESVHALTLSKLSHLALGVDRPTRRRWKTIKSIFICGWIRPPRTLKETFYICLELQLRKARIPFPAITLPRYLKCSGQVKPQKQTVLTRHKYQTGFGLEYVIQNEIERYKEKNCIDSFLNHPFKQCDWSDRKLKRSTPYICLARKAWQIEKLIDNINSNARRIQFPT